MLVLLHLVVYLAQLTSQPEARLTFAQMPSAICVQPHAGRDAEMANTSNAMQCLSSADMRALDGLQRPCVSASRSKPVL